MEMAATGRAAAAWRVASRGSRACGVIGVAAIPAKRCRHRRKLLVCSPSRLQNPVTDSPLPSKRPNTSAQACALKCRRVLVFASIVVVLHHVADVGHCRKPPLAVEERRRLTGYRPAASADPAMQVALTHPGQLDRPAAAHGSCCRPAVLCDAGPAGHDQGLVKRAHRHRRSARPHGRCTGDRRCNSNWSWKLRPKPPRRCGSNSTPLNRRRSSSAWPCSSPRPPSWRRTLRSTAMSEHVKIKPSHLSRIAIVYVRQSSAAQVEHNRESTARQYALTQRAAALGWSVDRVAVIDEDLGLSGATTHQRSGFARMTAEVALSHVGIILGLEVSRMARNNADWYRLLDLCSMTDTLIGDADGVYHPSLFNDRLLLGLKGTMSEA